MAIIVASTMLGMLTAVIRSHLLVLLACLRLYMWCNSVYTCVYVFCRLQPARSCLDLVKHYPANSPASAGAAAAAAIVGSDEADRDGGDESGGEGGGSGSLGPRVALPAAALLGPRLKLEPEGAAAAIVSPFQGQCPQLGLGAFCGGHGLAPAAGRYVFATSAPGPALHAGFMAGGPERQQPALSAPSVAGSVAHGMQWPGWVLGRWS